MKTRLIYLLMIIFTIFVSDLNGQTPCVECDDNSSTDGTYATALGNSTTAAGNFSFAAGTGSIANGIASFASGTFSIAGGNTSTAIGMRSLAIDEQSIAIGSDVQSTYANAITLGSGYSSQSKLVNNFAYSMMIGFKSIKPTFFISASTEWNKTGRVAIGNVNLAQPLAKLHIKADAGEVAAMLIEPNTWGNGAQAHISVGNLENGITVQKGSESTDMFFRSQGNYLFNSMGNVGVNTNKPLYDLHVAGSMFAKSFRLYNDAQPLEEGFVLVADELGNAYWGNPASVLLWQVNGNDIYYNRGHVGIGVKKPEEMLDIAGNILVNDAIIGKETKSSQWNDPFFLTLKGSKNEFASRIMLCKGDDESNQNDIKIINPISDGEVQFHVGGKINFVVRTDETVFGAHNVTDYALKVNGKIWTNEVEVKVQNWSDVVFEETYGLMPLSQLETFIEANHHLPDVPTEKEVLENGIELGEMNALLLKKIEELTLYVIELKNELGEIKQLSNQNVKQ